jgi:hypothetical protein
MLDPKTEEAVERMIRADRVNRQSSNGPLTYDGARMADFRAQLRGFSVADETTAQNAGDLKITHDARGLEYCSEKSYRMVESLNFIIVNARNRIGGFGLKGQLLVLTESAPNEWFIRIDAGGSAYQAPAKPDEMSSCAIILETSDNIVEGLAVVGFGLPRHVTCRGEFDRQPDALERAGELPTACQCTASCSHSRTHSTLRAGVLQRAEMR